MPSSIFYMEDIFHQHIKVFRNPQHKLGRWGAVPTFYPADSFGAESDSSGKVILVNATLFSDFSDIGMLPNQYTCTISAGRLKTVDVQSRDFAH